MATVLREKVRGRRVIVTLASPAAGEAPGQELVVVNYDPARSLRQRGLDCAFTGRFHLELAPQPFTFTTWGLALDRRDRISRMVEEAQEQSFRQRTFLRAGRLKVAAGRPDAFGPICDSVVTDVVHEKDGADWRTTFTAIDGRLEWEQGFVNESAVADQDLSTVRSILEASDKVLAGAEPEAAFRAAFPELLQRTGPAGKNATGLYMFGPSRDLNKQYLDRLGLKMFWNAGKLRCIKADGYTTDPAVVLQDGRTLLWASKSGRGFYKFRALLDHRLMPGRQVHLRDVAGKPLGAAAYRVEEATMTGSTFDQTYYVQGVLRPSALLGTGG